MNAHKPFIATRLRYQHIQSSHYWIPVGYYTTSDLKLQVNTANLQSNNM